jgi:hypothetical protein
LQGQRFDDSAVLAGVVLGVLPLCFGERSDEVGVVGHTDEQRQIGEGYWRSIAMPLRRTGFRPPRH